MLMDVRVCCVFQTFSFNVNQIHLFSSPQINFFHHIILYTILNKIQTAILGNLEKMLFA